MENETETGSIIGYYENVNFKENFFFEINQPITEEEQKRLSQFHENYLEILKDTVERLKDNFFNYKKDVIDYLLKRDLIVKQIDLPFELQDIVEELKHIILS